MPAPGMRGAVGRVRERMYNVLTESVPLTDGHTNGHGNGHAIEGGDGHGNGHAPAAVPAGVGEGDGEQHGPSGSSEEDEGQH